MRETFSSPALATQTAPLPTASATGRSPTSTCSCASGCAGSTLIARSRALSATQIAFGPTAAATGVPPTAISLDPARRPRAIARRAIRGPRRPPRASPPRSPDRSACRRAWTGSAVVSSPLESSLVSCPADGEATQVTSPSVATLCGRGRDLDRVHDARCRAGRSGSRFRRRGWRPRPSPSPTATSNGSEPTSIGTARPAVVRAVAQQLRRPSRWSPTPSRSRPRPRSGGGPPSAGCELAGLRVDLAQGRVRPRADQHVDLADDDRVDRVADLDLPDRGRGGRRTDPDSDGSSSPSGQQEDRRRRRPRRPRAARERHSHPRRGRERALELAGRGRHRRGRGPGRPLGRIDGATSVRRQLPGAGVAVVGIDRGRPREHLVDAGGSSGPSSDGRGRSACAWAYSVATAVSRWNGGSPVSRKQTTQPSA